MDAIGRNRSPAGTRAHVLFRREWAKWDLRRNHLLNNHLRQSHPPGHPGGFCHKNGQSGQSGSARRRKPLC